MPARIADMRYRLRTLLIVLALGPVVLAAAWPFIQPIAADFWFLHYGDPDEVFKRRIVIQMGPVPREPKGFHPVAEFLHKVLP